MHVTYTSRRPLLLVLQSKGFLYLHGSLTAVRCQDRLCPRQRHPLLERQQQQQSFTASAIGYANNRCNRFQNSHASVTVNARRFSTVSMTLTRVCRNPSTSATPTTTSKPPSSQDTNTADLPVSPVLLQEVRAIMSRHPAMTWMPVSDLYADLSPYTRREYVRPHKSMLHVLQKAKDELGISLNATGVFYAVGKMAEVAPKPQTTQQSKQLQSQQQQQQQSKKQTQPAVSSSPPSASFPAAASEELKGTTYPSVDFYYDVELTEFPPPPADMCINPAELQRHTTHSSTDGAVIAMSDFVAYIPPFFAPVRAVLARMPGYTEEHLQRYFQASSMEAVAVSGETYIRVHGGYEKLTLTGCEAAEEAFQQFRPQPSLATHFEKAFEGVTDKWMPLPELLRRVDPAVVAQLPFQGAAAIMYFAQMQHRFAFAVRQVPPREDGAAPATTEAAVLLRRPDYGGLECDTTPTPKSLSLIFTLVPADGQVEIVDVERQLTPGVRAELAAYYGGLPQFFAKHTPLFYVPPETPTVVMRLRYRQRVHVATLSLEEQLAFAQKFGKKSKIRVIRRRIAFRDNPSHPFLDPENLAKELSTYLPRRGFVSVRTFLKRTIPEELIMFLPPKIHNFFKNHPQYFTQFEYQQPAQWCLCRPDQPLPRGVIRQTFSEGELVRITAEYLQKKGPRPLSTVMLNIPRGAQDIVKKRYGGMYFFVTRFPQYFNVVLSSDNSNAQSSGFVHLIQVPSTELDDAAMATSGAATNDPLAPTTQIKREQNPVDGDGEDDDDYDGLD